MRISEKAQKSEILYLLINFQNIMFGYTPPLYGKSRKIEKMSTNQFWWVLRIIYLIDPFILKEYNLCSQNTENSLEQWKWNLEFWKKLIIQQLQNGSWLYEKTVTHFWNIVSAKHNIIHKFCIALFKCKNKLKIGWEN